jgi:hypothetical protein
MIDSFKKRQQTPMIGWYKERSQQQQKSLNRNKHVVVSEQLFVIKGFIHGTDLEIRFYGFLGFLDAFNIDVIRLPTSVADGIGSGQWNGCEAEI